MYKKIMVPVDLEHIDVLGGGLSVAAKMAEVWGGELVYAGVYGAGPSRIGHNEDAYKAALDAFVAEQPCGKLVKTSALPIYSHDPGVDIAPALVKAASDHDVDLIVMASHIPGWAEHVFHSNAGYVASHATVSVFVVR